ncbi:MAG: Small subunit (SSU) processome component, partial [Paramarteilia canceri]
YGMGLINTKNSLALCNEVNASSFCRRRLPIVMLKLNMAQNAKAAVGLVEHGHVRVGLDVVRDPAYIVTREMEDYISWSNKSKIKEKKLEYEQN